MIGYVIDILEISLVLVFRYIKYTVKLILFLYKLISGFVKWPNLFNAWYKSSTSSIYIICGQVDTCQSVNKLFHPTSKEKKTKQKYIFTHKWGSTNKYMSQTMLYLISNVVITFKAHGLNYVRKFYGYWRHILCFIKKWKMISERKILEFFAERTMFSKSLSWLCTLKQYFIFFFFVSIEAKIYFIPSII